MTNIEKIQALVRTLQHLDREETDSVITYESWDFQQKLLNAEIARLKQELKEGEQDASN